MKTKIPARPDSFDILKGGYIPSLNGWRAMAILLVLISHAYLTRGFPPEFRFFHLLGLLGVRLFFVLSGFLITHLLLLEAEKTGRISLKSFYLRRSLRIFPVYFTYLAVLGILSLFGWYHDRLSSWMGVLTYTRNIFGTNPSLTAHFWSLAVEEQFYLIWPVLIVVFILSRRFRLALLILLLPLVLCPLERMAGINMGNNGSVIGRIFGEWSILAYADSLAVGCLGAFLIRKVRYRLKPFFASLLLVCALAVIITGELCKWTGHLQSHGLDSFIPTVQALAAMLAMWISIFNVTGLAYRILNWPFMNWLGVLSYSLYVWHFLFLSVNAGSRMSQLVIYDWRVWWLPAFLMAIFSYYCIERPVLRLKQKIPAEILPASSGNKLSVP
jgi:peptidoglycan/LPS O-acetylase OafA/YrhL